ncbi:MAG: thiamine-phosphate kinase [Fibrobacteria bacterium]
MNRFFAPGGEFSLIERLFDTSHFARDGSGLGDDAYLLRAGKETWAVSTDSSVEGIHYRLDWTSPEAALEKALLSNLSDINAMGGSASLAFLNLGALKHWDDAVVDRLGATLARWEKAAGFKVVGGDTVRKDKESFFTFTVMGRVQGTPLLRSQARPGQRIYVSGTLGRSAAGLHLLATGASAPSLPIGLSPEPYISAHLLPRPPLALGPALAACSRPVAAIDISDGLSSELWHLSRQSGCRLTVEWGKLPYDEALGRLPGGEAWMDWVWNGGEEYQLLFTGDFSSAELDDLARHAEVREIGRVTAGEGVGFVDETGKERELQAAGWGH